MGVVTITAKSTFSDGDSVANVAHFGSDWSAFTSKNRPDQWICWDFHEMRVRPTHYTMSSIRSKSWIIEVSVDEKSWTRVDWKENVQVFKDEWGTASFEVSYPEAGRFIRLTQTAKNHCDYDFLSLKGVEFFGTLYE
jgi:hypothetical protein